MALVFLLALASCHKPPSPQPPAPKPEPSAAEVRLAQFRQLLDHVRQDRMSAEATLIRLIQDGEFADAALQCRHCRRPLSARFPDPGEMID